MSFLSGMKLPNIFVGYHEEHLLKDCPNDLKPVYYKRYVDNIFVLFNKPEHAQSFLEWISKKHENMKSAAKTEINGQLSFLGFKMFQENEKFLTSVFKKDTFSGVYSNSINFILLEYNFGPLHSSLNSCFNLSSDFFFIP